MTAAHFSRHARSYASVVAPLFEPLHRHLAGLARHLAPDGLPDPMLVRQLRELAWAVKTRAVTVLFVGPTFPEIPALEKEIKVIELPLPDSRTVVRPGR